VPKMGLFLTVLDGLRGGKYQWQTFENLPYMVVFQLDTFDLRRKRASKMRVWRKCGVCVGTARGVSLMNLSAYFAGFICLIIRTVAY
jgi:hypothetical protein